MAAVKETNINFALEPSTEQMARGKKKKNHGQKKANKPAASKQSLQSDDDDDAASNSNGEEVKEELTTEQEIAREAAAAKKEQRRVKALERARKKKEKEEIAAMPGPPLLTLRHVLVKHKEARNSFSKRTLTNVNKTKDEAISELEEILATLTLIQDTGTLESSFADFALSQSDCGTHVTGGKLDVQRRQMHINFEDVAWSLEVGELASKVVETESGCHILMRVG